MKRIITCIPNISEGRDIDKINRITAVIETVKGVKLLDVDPGADTNRTVITFAGEPEKVIDAAFLLYQTAAKEIDMRTHKGAHPRFGAVDVCPFVPIEGVTMDDCRNYAHTLAKRVGEALQIPVYCYESAALLPHRKNLAEVRSGEYEGLANKLNLHEGKPDFGVAEWVPTFGGTAIGARDFLVAVNFNLNTSSVRRANAIAFDVREMGRTVKKVDNITGKESEEKVPGRLKACKAIGWFIEEYGYSQVSMNLTNLSITAVHEAFDAVCESAQSRGIRVTGTEIVGVIPLKVLTEAGKHFLRKQNRSTGVSEEELVKTAIRTMNLSEVRPFDPEKKVIEYVLNPKDPKALVGLNLQQFVNLTSSEAPAPGGGSVAAYCGAMGAALGAMVANLSSHKRGWDEKWEYFGNIAEEAVYLQEKLLQLVDADTKAFDGVLAAMQLPKKTEEEKVIRQKAIEEATFKAAEVPLEVAKTSAKAFPILERMILEGNPNSITDAGVGVLCTHSAVWGACMNVRINLKDLQDSERKAILLNAVQVLESEAEHELERLKAAVYQQF